MNAQTRGHTLRELKGWSGLWHGEPGANWAAQDKITFKNPKGHATFES
jgi:hypothetical protein